MQVFRCQTSVRNESDMGSLDDFGPRFRSEFQCLGSEQAEFRDESGRPRSYFRSQAMSPLLLGFQLP